MGTDTSPIDEKRVEQFAERLLTTYTEGAVTLMIDLADRTGLLVTARIVDYDPSTRRYALPAEHAACLTGPGSLNLTPFSRIITLLATHVPGVAKAFHEGGGVPYEAFRPEFTEVMDRMSRGLMDDQLLDGILPLTGDLPERLTAGVRVADIGCGTGHAVNLMARAYPRSTVVGYDLAADAIAAARAEAWDWGLTNARFEVLDVTQLRADPPFAAVFAFDAIHDQVDPAGVLRGVRAALAPDGIFVMMDVKGASAVEDNVGNPFAPLFYGISTLHCMTVSLAHGGAGLGTMWGEQLALRMLADAGFAEVTLHDVPDDPFDTLYVARAG